MSMTISVADLYGPYANIREIRGAQNLRCEIVKFVKIVKFAHTSIDE